MEDRKSNNRFRITSIIIAMAFLVGAFSGLITLSHNVSATSADNTWISNGASYSGISTSWENGTLTTGQNVWFTAAHVGTCTWNNSLGVTSFGSFNMKTGYTGTVTQTASFSVASYSQVAGTFWATNQGNPYILTCNGDFAFTGGTIGDGRLNVKMAGEGSSFTGNVPGFADFQVSANITLNGDISNFFNTYTTSVTIDAGKTLTIASGHSFQTWTSSVFTFTNNGVIAGSGTYKVAMYDSDMTLNFGAVNCPVLVYNYGTAVANRRLTLGSDAILGSALTVESLDATRTITVDLSSNNYNLSATDITIGVRGAIVGRGSKISCSGNWNSTDGAFIAGNSAVQFTGTGSVKSDPSDLHSYEFYDVDAAYSGQTTSLANNMHLQNDLTLHGGTFDCLANMTVWYNGTFNYNLNGTGSINNSTWLYGKFPFQIDANLASYATFASSLDIPGLNIYSSYQPYHLNLTRNLTITGSLLFTIPADANHMYFSTNGYSLTFNNLDATNGKTSTFDMTGSNITCTGDWDSSGSDFQLVTTNAKVIMDGDASLFKTSANQTINELIVQGNIETLSDLAISKTLNIANNGNLGFSFGNIVKYSSNPVISDGGLNHKDPSLIYANGQYYVAYSHQIPGSWNIRMMYSADFHNWIDMGIALTQTEVWEGTSIGAPYLFYDSGTYYLFYQGQGTNWEIGYATNNNIDNIGGWVKYSSNPIITNGAGYDAFACYDATVTKYGSTFYLYYISQNVYGAERKLCLATSTNMITWAKSPANPIFETDTHPWGMEAGDILEVTSGIWLMFTSQWDGSAHQVIRQLVSTNLNIWYESQPITMTYTQTWESGGIPSDWGVGSPAIISRNNELLIMYQGHNDTNWCLGVAVGAYYNLTFAGDGANFTNLGVLHAQEIRLINLTNANVVIAGLWTGTMYLQGSSSSFAVSITEPMEGNVSANKPVQVHVNSLVLGIQPYGKWFNITSATGLTWSAELVDPNAIVTFTLSGLESGRMYRLYIDGNQDALLTASGSGVISFTYSGPWSEHQFEIVATSITGSISPLVNLIFIMFAIGIVVGVIAEGTYSIRKNKMLSTPEMMRMLFNMLIYIVIGITGIGVLYSIVA